MRHRSSDAPDLPFERHPARLANAPPHLLAKRFEIGYTQEIHNEDGGSKTPLAPALTRFSERRPQENGDEIMRAHLRNIELYLQRLITESEQGRVQSTGELRNDIRVLTRTIAALAEDQPR